MYFYYTGLSDYEGSSTTSLSHVVKYTILQFKDLLASAYAKAYLNSKSNVACVDYLEDDAIKILITEYGFEPVEYATGYRASSTNGYFDRKYKYYEKNAGEDNDGFNELIADKLEEMNKHE